MIYAGKLRHQSSRYDFHLANFTARLRLTIQIDVAANRVLDVFERLFDVSALRMTTGQFRATNRHTFLVFEQGHMKFSLHKGKRTLCA
jgi:hypothetical protein